MTKYLKLLMVALFATMSFTLISCGSDEDEPSSGNIVGTWKVETMNLDDDWWQVDYIRFSENGTFKSVAVVHFMDDTETYEDRGTWSKHGNKLTIDGETATIKELSNKKMVLNLDGIDITYNKCSDSEMDKYL